MLGSLAGAGGPPKRDGGTQPAAPAVAFLTLAILINAFTIYQCDPPRGGG